MKIPFVSLFLAVLPLCCFADNCDCTHFPIQPDSCRSKCASKSVSLAAHVLDSAARSDSGIPGELLTKARCIVVAPGSKNDGTEVGRGFTICRHAGSEAWSSPSAIRIAQKLPDSSGAAEGTSDKVFLIMSNAGEDQLKSGNLTLDDTATVAAGPVGSTLPTAEAPMYIDVFSYKAVNGVFGGKSLKGLTISQDNKVNYSLYGRSVNSKEILNGEIEGIDSSLGDAAKRGGK